MTSNVTWKDWLQQQGLLELLYPEGSIGDLGPRAWQPNDADQRAAWRFLIELRSRIATQQLKFRSGDEESALTSVYQLFGLFRECAKENDGCYHFSVLTLQLLDLHVRPFTAHWHKQKMDGHLESTDVRIDFRATLLGVQAHLRRALPLYSHLARVPSVPAVATASHHSAFVDEPVELAPIDADIGSVNLAEVFESERAEILSRRYKVQGRDPADGETPYDGIGLALSGGGIRSATFAMGVVTVLAQRRILREVDYLSTVSGGGYFGALISTLLGATTDAAKAETVFDTCGGKENQVLRAVRNHSKYLIEGGLRTIAVFLGVTLFGLLTSLLLVAQALLLGALLLTVGHDLVIGAPWPPAWLALGVAAVGYALTQVGQHFRARDAEKAGMALWIGGLLGAAALALLALQLDTSWLATDTARFAALFGAVAVGILARLIAPRFSGLFLVALAPVLLLLGALELALLLSPRNLLLAIAATALATLFVNLNFASPHRYYRDRLARTYILERRGSGIKPLTSPPLLSALNPSGFAPYHLVNAALNVPASKNVELRGRKTDFFLFSKAWCGSPTTKYFRTKNWESKDRSLDFATAIAISGAAAAPNMGTNAISRFRQWLALFNVRLDYWLKHPERFGPLLAWRYFWHEMLADMDESMSYLNVSDGGHIEDLGIYELLRRQCKYIVAVDGEADPNLTCGALVTLTQLALIDLGVRIEPDLSNLRSNGNGIGRAHFELFQIKYASGARGLLLYVKASLTGNESEFLKRYRADHPTFPHESTAQQLYSERQFEAYRALGEHIATDLFRPDLVGSWSCDRPASEWFLELSKRLL